MSELLTVEEVAARLRITKQVAYRLAREGKLPSVRVGRSVRMSTEALESFIQTGGVR